MKKFAGALFAPKTTSPSPRPSPPLGERGKRLTDFGLMIAILGYLLYPLYLVENIFVAQTGFE